MESPRHVFLLPFFFDLAFFLYELLGAFLFLADSGNRDSLSFPVSSPPGSPSSLLLLPLVVVDSPVRPVGASDESNFPSSTSGLSGPESAHPKPSTKPVPSRYIKETVARSSNVSMSRDWFFPSLRARARLHDSGTIRPVFPHD